MPELPLHRGTRLERGLYLITPDERDPARLLERVLPLLPFAACVQLRAKSMGDHALRDAGTRLRDACAETGVAFIVNDDARLAHALHADGVHLGEHDGGIPEARTLLGDAAIIGVSCYDDLQRARDAAAAGADYIAFGAMFPSMTKPHAPPAPFALVERAKRELGLPVAAIGGITLDNALPLVDAGAGLLAVIGDIFSAPDPAARAAAYAGLFD